MFCPKCGSQNIDTARFCRKCGKNLPERSQVRQVVTPVDRDAFLGQVLDGKYRIDGKLGSGGMGDVYRATRLLIGDTVAVKILHPHLARDPQAAERFRREAVMATKLRHRNVVGIYDVGVSAVHQVPYILMELAEGYTLRQIINQYKVLPLDFAVTVTTQVCSALGEAHELGIVHRDIKPENIIANETTTGWYIKVLDFGIAKLYNQTDIGLTQDGSAMGTPQYMSPEQCLGENLDARSDVYSVGIMLYEMLTGTVPFKSPTASAIAIHHVQTMPQAPRLVNDEIHPAVEGVILKSIWKQREHRHQKASELAKDLINAATLAFRSGKTVVPETPIAAPEIEPEFAAVDEPVDDQPVVPDEMDVEAEDGVANDDTGSFATMHPKASSEHSSNSNLDTENYEADAPAEEQRVLQHHEIAESPAVVAGNIPDNPEADPQSPAKTEVLNLADIVTEPKFEAVEYQAEENYLPPIDQPTEGELADIFADAQLLLEDILVEQPVTTEEDVNNSGAIESVSPIEESDVIAEKQVLADVP